MAHRPQNRYHVFHTLLWLTCQYTLSKWEVEGICILFLFILLSLLSSVSRSMSLDYNWSSVFSFWTLKRKVSLHETIISFEWELSEETKDQLLDTPLFYTVIFNKLHPACCSFFSFDSSSLHYTCLFSKTPLGYFFFFNI